MRCSPPPDRPWWSRAACGRLRGYARPATLPAAAYKTGLMPPIVRQRARHAAIAMLAVQAKCAALPDPSMTKRYPRCSWSKTFSFQPPRQLAYAARQHNMRKLRSETNEYAANSARKQPRTYPEHCWPVDFRCNNGGPALRHRWSAPSCLRMAFGRAQTGFASAATCMAALDRSRWGDEAGKGTAAIAEKTLLAPFTRASLRAKQHTIGE